LTLVILFLNNKDRWGNKARGNKDRWGHRAHKARQQVLRDKVQIKILAAPWTVHRNQGHKAHNKVRLLARNLQAARHNKHSLHRRQVQAQVKLAQQDQMMALK
jgi:hypothetical protein